jgi:Histidine kinase/Y_Y_Y domain
VAGDSTLALQDTISLGSGKTRLLVELSGISFRSGKEISYEYRLKGLDSNWRHITNNSIEFPALPFGNYTLEVRSIDRWGKRSSSPGMIFIRHSPPFWLTTWFILCSYLLMALAAGAGVYIYHRNRRQKREEGYQLKKKVQDLEMMALRAQMNPHFIFNCLTSIQYHIMNADVKNASTYLHKFSTLIRQTLQNSNASMILLRDEIKLLELYLDLEKLRLGDRMDFRIDLSPELDPDHQMIPPMIVQPYVENAVKHGIGPLEGVKGMVLIGFKKSDNCICCTIEDNGPGMDASRQSSSAEAGHLSLGKSITEKRIHTLNALQKEKIHILITDKRSSGWPSNGTLIQLFFPISSN